MSLQRRRSIRLKDYDYSAEGSYFVTAVTYAREPIFGSIEGGVVALSAAGRVVREIWNNLPERYPQIELDCAVVMPDHFHGIIHIVGENNNVGAIHELPQRLIEFPQRLEEFPQRFKELPQRLEELPQQRADEELIERMKSRRKMLLPMVMGYFKMNAAKRINLLLGTPGQPVWQRNYYEHIITTEKEYNNIAEYIFTNPQRWDEDEENPVPMRKLLEKKCRSCGNES